MGIGRLREDVGSVVDSVTDVARCALNTAIAEYRALTATVPALLDGIKRALIPASIALAFAFWSIGFLAAGAVLMIHESNPDISLGVLVLGAGALFLLLTGICVGLAVARTKSALHTSGISSSAPNYGAHMNGSSGANPIGGATPNEVYARH